MSEGERNPGIVEWYGGGERPGHRCGYCGNSSTNVSDGLWAHTLTVQDYQDMIDRGWRRSGKYCYKPKMDTTCCPHYTIKQEALKFRLSKSHKKVLKLVNRFLIHGKKKGEEQAVGRDKGEGLGGAKGEETAVNQVSHDTKEEMEGEQSKKTPKTGLGADPNKPKCKKAKELRKEKRLAKQSDPPTDTPKPQKQQKCQEKTLEDFLNEPDRADNCAHRLEIKLVRVNPPSEDFEATQHGSYRVFKVYQMGIHKEKEDDCSVDQFENFLCEGPLQEEHREGGLSMGYGSFHQQYWLDGRIIAVGVIDILPSCVSSVYLYYDPDYDFLSLGTYSALREIAFVRELNKMAADLKYYYMGFYIHSCPKMRYKAQYYPSYLLCPEVFSWHPVEECSLKLDKNKYSRFADPDKVDEEGQVDLDKVLVLHKRTLMTYAQYLTLNPNRRSSQEAVRKYARFVGQKCAYRMLLYRD